jgi:hypothetical protein
MIKRLRPVVLALVAAAVTSVATAATETNVLQNISLQLTIYRQGATNATTVKDQVTSYNTKSLIAALGLVTTNNFGPGAKLVLSSVYSNLSTVNGSAVYSNIFSTNLTVPTNDDFNGAVYMRVGGGEFGFLTDTFTIIGNELTDNNTGEMNTISDNIVALVLNTNEYVIINTNMGFKTTLTPSTNSSGQVTNIAVLEQQAPPGSIFTVFTNVSNSIDVLYNGTNNTLYPVTNYLNFTSNSAEIVVETGAGLNTSNAIPASQTGFCIRGLNINYGGATNLVLNLQGFVKQSLKVDILSAGHGNTPKVVEDIFGAGSTWNVIGSGYAGGTFTTNTASLSTNEVAAGNLGYLSNAVPVVVEGTVTVGFLKNLAQ